MASEIPSGTPGESALTGGLSSVTTATPLTTAIRTSSVMYCLNSWPFRSSTLPWAVMGCCSTLSQATFPSSPRRGGRDINKISRSLLYGADGVVIKFQENLVVLFLPPRLRGLRMLRSFFLIAQTPLLGEEGKVLQFIVAQRQDMTETM